MSKKKDSDLRLWATHREESVYFQREAQVNFWTVLGGLAMAALLTQLSPLLAEIQAGRWHLTMFLVTSILILANSWVQTTWGSLVLKWPISIVSTVIVLFSMLVESIQCLLVTNPSGWLAATAALILCALLLQVHFERSGAWKIFPPEFTKRFKASNRLYAFFALLCLGGALQLYIYPSRIAEMVWGCVALFSSILALYMQHQGMQLEKKELGIP
ncbi:MAG: hypothetical protein FJZ96_00135 [Chloroflexi bacterium]|nr:hypothetical protein [Chloroflexota bacterium]